MITAIFGKKFVSMISIFTFIMMGMMWSPLLTPSVHGSTVTEIQNGVKDVDKDNGDAASGTSRVKSLLAIVANVLLFLIGSFAVIMIIISGFRFVTANGDANTVTQAKNTIIYAVVGIVIAVSAYAIVSFVLGAL